MFLYLSGLWFAAFTANVIAGAWRGQPVLGDVGEMLLLFAAAVCFVVAVLQRERAENPQPQKD